MRQRKSLWSALLAAVLCLAMVAPAFAAQTKTITFELKNAKGEVVKTVTAYQGDADTYGPSEDAQVRSTYYYDGKVYDLDDGQAVSGDLTGNMTFTYTAYTAKSSGTSGAGSTTGGSSSAVAAYDVVVRYVDESGNVISTRTITMNGHDHEFYAPAIFTRTVGSQTTYYVVQGSNKVTFKWNDKSTLTKDIVYQKIDTATGSVDWTIYYMDSETGDTLGSVTQSVAAGETATKALNATMQFDGKRYHLNAYYKSGSVSYTFGKSGKPITYVYYDPDGYDTSEQTKTITVEYRNIADGSVVKTKSVKVSSYASAATEVDLDESFETNNTSWVLAKGQKTPIEVSYFSPKDTYQVYVRDVNDTDNENTIVVYEDVVEDGGVITTTVINRVTPGTTTAVAVNQTTGATRNLGTFGADGAQLTNGQNTANTTSNADGTDVSEDGVTLERESAPQASASQAGLTQTQGIALVIGIAALAVIVILAMRRKRRS